MNTRGKKIYHLGCFKHPGFIIDFSNERQCFQCGIGPCRYFPNSETTEFHYKDEEYRFEKSRIPVAEFVSEHYRTLKGISNETNEN